MQQHGYTAKQLHEKASKPDSLIGTVVTAAAQVEEMLNSQENTESGSN
jgi:hypothetical protein